jgi:multicomponent Na+:H+ antiporter subunit E
MQPTQHLDPHPGKPATPVKTATARALAVAALLALLWFVLAGGDAASWIVGVPAVAAALLLARRVGAPPPAWRLDPAGRRQR